MVDSLSEMVSVSVKFKLLSVVVTYPDSQICILAHQF